MSGHQLECRDTNSGGNINGDVEEVEGNNNFSRRLVAESVDSPRFLPERVGVEAISLVSGRDYGAKRRFKGVLRRLHRSPTPSSDQGNDADNINETNAVGEPTVTPGAVHVQSGDPPIELTSSGGRLSNELEEAPEAAPDETVLVNAILVEEDPVYFADVHSPPTVYEATPLRFCNTKTLMLLCAMGAIIVAVATGLSIGLTRQVTPPVTTAPTVNASFSWIANTSVAMAAEAFPENTVATIISDMESLNQTNASSVWYTDEMWISNGFQPSSAQARAWKWLVSSSDVVRFSQPEVAARFSLAVLYIETEGRKWKRNTNWLNPATHVCDWSLLNAGDANSKAICYKEGLKQLFLNHNRLEGSLPAEIALLTTLTALKFLGNSNLRGIIPSSIAQLTRLESLHIGYNALSGSIPSSISQLTRLTTLRLIETGLSGPLPIDIGQLSRLFELDLDRFSLSGSVPQSIRLLNQLRRLAITFAKREAYHGFPWDLILSNWTQMTALRMSSTYPYIPGNQTVPFPAAISKLSRLRELAFDTMDFKGTLPDVLGQLTNLRGLSLSSTALSGSLPASLGKLSKLLWLWLPYNKLTGTIPDSFWNAWQSLVQFGIPANGFYGTLPTAIGISTSIRYLSLNSNDFSGTIPSQLALLQGAEYFELQNNSFTGSIPSELGALGNLSYVDLTDVPQLTGSIPIEICAAMTPSLLIDCNGALSCDSCND